MSTLPTDDMSLPLLIRGQYIKDLSFENPNPLLVFSGEGEAQPSIQVNVQAKAQHLGDKTFEVVLDIKVDARKEESVMFIVELSYGGIVSIRDDVQEADINPLIMIQAPHLLFPYARNIICDMTRDGGYPPLLLAPVDFLALFRQQMASPESSSGSNSGSKTPPTVN